LADPEKEIATVTVHAIQTGSVRIKRAQAEGRGRGLARRLAIFTDAAWTDWLPTYAWVIDHPDGIIVVDTGQGAHLLESAKSLHPYVRWEVAFRIEPEQEIGPQLRAIGITPRDVKRVILTHLHMDHDGGLAHFPHSEFLVTPGANCARRAAGPAGCANRWPSWFDPAPLELAQEPFGPFRASKKMTARGDVVAVATPGHTADHVSIVVQEQDAAILLAGDASYTEQLMLAGKVDGVSADENVARDTLDRIKRFVLAGPTIYLPTHDPDAATRLTKRRVAHARDVAA
jgi:N-acyl homoserine lactone hydrolase